MTTEVPGLILAYGTLGDKDTVYTTVMRNDELLLGQ